MKRTILKIGSDSFPIHVGAGVVSSLAKSLANRESKRAFIIADKALKAARKKTIQVLERAGWEVHEIPVTAGESLKQMKSIYPIYGELLRRKANRDSLLLALGGGTIGDTAGFIAATYLRGISWVGIPTTVLAQVDSSVGGKTGINHEAGKNLIGSIYQPSLVVCDTDFLETLKKREMVSGLGEVFKYGIIFDSKFFRYLEKSSLEFIDQNPAVLLQAINKSVKWKCHTVSMDPLEQKGIREVLNFGHTFGHALESLTHYKKFQHGEAVIWGMRFAILLSVRRGFLDPAVFSKIDRALSLLPVPSLPRGMGARKYLKKMGQDKKVKNGKIRFVLLKEIGKTYLDPNVTERELLATLQEFIDYA